MRQRFLEVNIKGLTLKNLGLGVKDVLWKRIYFIPRLYFPVLGNQTFVGFGNFNLGR